MQLGRPSRSAWIAVVAAVLALLSVSGARGQSPAPGRGQPPGQGPGQGQPPGAGQALPPTQPRQAPPLMRVQAQRPTAPPDQEHLAQWMERHSNLSLADQQKALEQEPGFRDLPAATQQRMRDDLTRLNRMSPEQRRRALERTEAMEHLTPQQQGKVNGALGQLGALPLDRRRLVAQTFWRLRAMTAQQRQAFLNSSQSRRQFSDQERSTLFNLLEVEPYLPLQSRSSSNNNTGPGRP